MTTKPIYLSPPHMGGKEQKYFNNAFDSNWIAPLGPHVNEFEAEIASYLGVKHAAALNSGTSALHLALIIAGIKEGDKVLCPSLTFAATANVIMYVKAQPIFIDSDSNTWVTEIELLEKSADAFLFGERGKFSPKGVLGGKEASKNIFTFEGDDGPTNPKMVSKIVGVKLKRGQSVRIDTAGGGGYGNPLERSKQARDYDVQLGYVTEEKP